MTVALAKPRLCWKTRKPEQHAPRAQSEPKAMSSKQLQPLATLARFQESPVAWEVACSCYAARGGHGQYQAFGAALARCSLVRYMTTGLASSSTYHL
jgi:hypothetical protein